MKKFLGLLPYPFVFLLFFVGGIIGGLGIYTIYISRAHSYLSDQPETCINCHIMVPYYSSWRHSSHAEWATCNDCHVPQNNLVNGYAFKAMDGLYHAAVFTLNAEPQVIRPRDGSYAVIMKNCIRCHEHLNTALVETGMITYKEVKKGEGKACWECHQEVPHTKVSNISGTPNAYAPLPKTPVPDWLKKRMNERKNK